MVAAMVESVRCTIGEPSVVTWNYENIRSLIEVTDYKHNISLFNKSFLCLILSKI